MLGSLPASFSEGCGEEAPRALRWPSPVRVDQGSPIGESRQD